MTRPGTAVSAPVVRRAGWKSSIPADLDDPERRQLLAAATAVLDRTGWWGFKIQSVLREANLSIRSFYRHFDRKSDLLLALLQSELGGAAERLRRATESESEPVAQLRAYIRATIDMAYSSDISKPTSLFASRWRELLPDYPEEIDRCTAELIRPLCRAILAGCADGSLDSPAPDVDARAIFSFVASVTADQAVTGGVTPRREIELMVIPFVERALRIEMGPMPEPGEAPADRAAPTRC